MILLARPKRFELLTPRFVVWRAKFETEGERRRSALLRQSRSNHAGSTIEEWDSRLQKPWNIFESLAVPNIRCWKRTDGDGQIVPIARSAAIDAPAHELGVAEA